MTRARCINTITLMPLKQSSNADHPGRDNTAVLWLSKEAQIALVPPDSSPTKINRVPVSAVSASHPLVRMRGKIKNKNGNLKM